MRTPRTFRASALAVLLATSLLAGCNSSPDDTAQATATPQPSVSPSPSVPKSPRPVPPADPAPDRLTLVATGDVLLHERLWTTARRDGRGGSWDFAPLLAGVRSLVSPADLGVCHLEVPLAPPGGPYLDYPIFQGPPQIAPALKQTGYDACTTASNHSLDRGGSGVDRTLATLERAGLRHAGTARSATEAATPTIVDVRGVKVALLSYTYGLNGMRAPAGQSWRVSLINVPVIKAMAKKARAAGAQIVVVSCHWGNEYLQTATPQQRTIAGQLLADDNIDLVLGHHAHVVQPMERLNGKWVAYGLGNLVAAHRRPDRPNAEGALTRFTFRRLPTGRWSVERADYAALLMTDTVPVRVLEVRRELARPGLAPARKARLALAQRRTEAVLTSLGAGRAGAQPIIH